MSELYIRRGKRYYTATPSEVCEAATQYLALQATRERALIANPTQARAFLKAQAGLDHEQFGLIYLDNRHRVLFLEVLFYGTLDGAAVHMREVVKAALKHGAAAVMAFHNHPSGSSLPSAADEKLTRTMKEALALVDIRLLDHLILGTDGCVSLAERGQV